MLLDLPLSARSPFVSVVVETLLSFSGKVVVFPIMGQSNAVGRGGPIDGVLDATDADILMYNSGGLNLITAADPIDHFNESPDQIGFGLSFAKKFKTDSGASKVILIGCGQGGAGFANGLWMPNSGTTWTNAIARCEAAWTTILSAHPTAVIGGILWMQGEDEVSDYETVYDGSDGNRYGSMLHNFIFGVREKLSFTDQDTPFILGDIPVITSDAYANVVAEIRAVPALFPRTGLAAGGEILSTFEPTHYDAASLRTIGDNYVTAFASSLTNDVAFPDYSTYPAEGTLAFGMSTVGLSDGDPIIMMGASASKVIENKNLVISGGYLNFNAAAELRFPNDAATKLLDRDFVLKVKFRTSNLNTAKGIISIYDTAAGNRSFLLRVNVDGTLEFYGTNVGTTATEMLVYTLSSNVWTDVEIRRVGTSLTMKVGGVVEDTYTLASGFTFYEVTDTNIRLLLGDYGNGRNFDGDMESFSLDFLT
jgi:hypothetical protein